MALDNLTIIGERINPGFLSSKALLESQDIKGLQELAVAQVHKGAKYLTINVGEQAVKDPAFLAAVIQAVQAVVDVPLSFDYPNLSVQEVCLKTYDAARARGRKPIVNSLTELRWDMLDVLKIQPAKLVLMASERKEDGAAVPNHDAREIALTARRMVHRLVGDGHHLAADDLFLDVSLCPIATDTEGQTRRAIEAIRLIGRDPELRGVHMLVGLSNLGIMLPKHALDGSRLSVKVESSFLTLTMPHGLDTILGTPGREYQMLPEDDFVFRGFKEAIACEGFDTLTRVQELYQRN
jgi:5-methyltetrahydrofolate--homocysteine methyltransferase